MTKTDTKMTKGELAQHIATQHPELIYPPLSILKKCPKDELERMHRDLHK